MNLCSGVTRELTRRFKRHPPLHQSQLQYVIVSAKCEAAKPDSAFLLLIRSYAKQLVRSATLSSVLVVLYPLRNCD